MMSQESMGVISIGSMMIGKGLTRSSDDATSEQIAEIYFIFQILERKIFLNKILPARMTMTTFMFNRIEIASTF